MTIMFSILLLLTSFIISIVVFLSFDEARPVHELQNATAAEGQNQVQRHSGSHERLR